MCVGGGGTLHVCVGVWCWLLLFMVFGVVCNFSLVTRLHYTYCTILCVCGGGWYSACGCGCGCGWVGGCRVQGAGCGGSMETYT